MKKKYLFYCILALITTPLPLFGTVTLSTQTIDKTTAHITLNFDIEPGNHVYKEYIACSLDNPAIALSDWHTDATPINTYDPIFKETKQIFDKPFSITLSARAQDTETFTNDTHLHVSYYAHTNKKITEEVLSIDANKLFNRSHAPKLEQHIAVADNTIETTATTNSTQAARTAPHTKTSWSAYISDLVQNSDSLWIQLLLVMLLGMLLSLTPCIYPMIPITVGILQAQGSTSLWKNFLLSFSYTTGIATTFALLGLLAAFTGQLFGSIMSNPFVIVGMVALLVYLALSMFGLYEMYIPSFIQNTNNSAQGGSFMSAFLFGVVSGSVASPCLSPGLVLLLSIVTAIGSLFIGFILLFAFGIGLGIPLLIIGTFSSSLNVLPKAGMWMVEVKKFFGFIMFGMCFYFLNNIMPWHYLLILITGFTAWAGGFYMHGAQKSFGIWRPLKTIFGMALLASSVMLTAQTIKAWHMRNTVEDSMWIHDYNTALTQAQKEHKKLFVDIGAPYCSLCKAIDKTLLHETDVINTLKQCIAAKIDGSADKNQTIIKKYGIIGFPTILLVDADSETIIKQWGGELYGTPKETFIKELHSLI